MILEIKELPKEKLWGLFIDGELFGTSKLQCDVQLSKKLLERAVAKGLNT